MDQNQPYSGDNPQPSKSFKNSTPDEVAERVENAVAKGIAAAGGAVKGVANKLEETQLGETAKKAIEQTGQTTRDVAGTAVKEFKQTKDEVKGGSSSSSSSSSTL